MSGHGIRLAGGLVLDVATGEQTRQDVVVVDGHVGDGRGASDLETVEVDGLTVMFGLWDCHAHPGGLMYDPRAVGYFESVAERTARAGANLVQAAGMGVTGVRSTGEGDGIDLAWRDAFSRGNWPGPRLRCAGPALRTTGGHGTAYPRRYVAGDPHLVADGPTEIWRGVRGLAERGVDWVKILLTGGLYSVHEAVDSGQLADPELEAAMAAARQRGLPVAAHCGSARLAERFARLGGRSVEHGYALDEQAAAALAAAGTFLVPTIGVTHDARMMEEDGWPVHAAERARASAAGHAAALHHCLEQGVKIATGADLNPIGPRLHAELRLLETAGMDRLSVLRAATAGSRELMGLGTETAPRPGSAADLIMVEGSPLDDLGVLQQPRGVMVCGRLVVDPRQAPYWLLVGPGSYRAS